MSVSKDATRNATEALVLEFHATADSLTTNGLEKFYGKNAILRFGNEKEVKGVDGIRKFFEGVFPLLKSMKHELVDVDRIGNKIYQSVFITYVVKNDPEEREIKIPVLGKMFLLEDGEEEGKMSRFEVFGNPSEVFARIEDVRKMA
ncbi:hypothetical protein BHYA_0044g00420 [Botrytis hyacinthi]|uniref:Nuclear transport factor 2 domain-containing protein n=1 Tax=Botrytis hyacinthi TaxID=278943 RepID=A0A4Z1GY55_9HELO|nr:hypothetical protein BHYA_0044g00420 [Botrytis hyacinthi]